MSNPSVGKGRCLCGKVKVTAPSIGNKIHACHCGMCQRWAGGPSLSVDCGNDVSFEGEGDIGIYDSSDWAQRGFCKICGGHLFYRVKDRDQYFLPVGIFDDGEAFVLDAQLFIDEKPSYYCFSNVTHNVTGAELFAKYTPKKDPYK